MKKTTSKKMEKTPSPNLVGSPKINVHWSVNSQRGQNLGLGWQLAHVRLWGFLSAQETANSLAAKPLGEVFLIGWDELGIPGCWAWVWLGGGGSVSQSLALLYAYTHWVGAACWLTHHYCRTGGTSGGG